MPGWKVPWDTLIRMVHLAHGIINLAFKHTVTLRVETMELQAFLMFKEAMSFLWFGIILYLFIRNHIDRLNGQVIDESRFYYLRLLLCHGVLKSTQKIDMFCKDHKVIALLHFGL